MTEAKRKQNGSKTEANIFFGNRSALKAFLSQMRLSKEIFQRSAETSETCCNFTCITEAKRKENGSGAEATKKKSVGTSGLNEIRHIMFGVWIIYRP